MTFILRLTRSYNNIVSKCTVWWSALGCCIWGHHLGPDSLPAVARSEEKGARKWRRGLKCQKQKSPPRPSDYRPSNEDFHKLKCPHSVPRQLSLFPHTPSFEMLFRICVFNFCSVQREQSFSYNKIICKRLSGGLYCARRRLRGNLKSIWKESRSSVCGGLGSVGP